MKPGHIHPTTKSLEPLTDKFRFQMWRIRTAIYAGQDAHNLFQRPPSRWFRRAPVTPSTGERGTFSNGLDSGVEIIDTLMSPEILQPGLRPAEDSMCDALLGSCAHQDGGHSTSPSRRSDDRPIRATFLSKAHRAAHLARSVIGRVFYRAGQGIGLIVLVAFSLLWLTTVDALINAPQPTERCFPTMSSGEYCRTQSTWELP